MRPATFLSAVLGPGLSLLPPRFDSMPARALLTAIALQESQLIYRKQIGGPARSYWQFERAGVHGVLTHPSTGGLAASLCEALDVAPHVDGVYEAITFADLLACGFARLLLWSSPNALPTREQPQNAWREYLACWRPGKPRPMAWGENFRRGWQSVQPLTGDDHGRSESL